jgi:hypothetical protein
VLSRICPGAWFTASVCIERMMQMSSAIEPVCGSSSDISAPTFP